MQVWSTNTLRRMCTADGKGKHYPVTQAGAYTESDARNFQALADLAMDLVFRVRAKSAG